VWRLPPTLATSEGKADVKAQMEAIGESDRMTLKFRKKA
jgi:predicted methyltransferase